MNYDQLEARIKTLASSASEAARYRFAHDTLLLMHRSVEDDLAFDDIGLNLPLLDDILAKIDVESTAELKEKLKKLGRSIGVSSDVAEKDFDDVWFDVAENYPEIADFLCAIDNWLEYRATRNPFFIERMAINRINSLDNYIGGDCGEYSTDNMLGAPEMREELHRLEHFLGPRRA